MELRVLQRCFAAGAVLTTVLVGCDSNEPATGTGGIGAVTMTGGVGAGTGVVAGVSGGAQAPVGGAMAPVGGAGGGTTGMTAGTMAAGTGGMMTAGTDGGGGMMSTQPAGNSCPGTPPPAIKLTMIADGFVGPTHIAQAPGDPTRLYVTEQRGTVRIVENGTLKPESELALDLRSEVNAEEIVAGSYGEGGLLAMVFDRDFETSKRLWLSYTIPGPEYRLSEFKMNTPGTIDPASKKEVLKFKQYPFGTGDATNHVGSMVAWGPDGLLYVSRGDGGGENDRQMSGQDTSDDLCSILRIDPDTYPTPVPGNLEGHVWSYGFRNPWRFSFDRVTGDMYIGDVGQDPTPNGGYEEINIEPAGAGSGRNYGWRSMEKLQAPYQGPCSGDCGGTIGPAVTYATTQTANSVIGGYVYRGKAIPGLVGRYVWADWSEREIKTLVYAGEDDNHQPKVCDEHGTGTISPTKVRSFGEDLDGELYMLTGGSGTLVISADIAGAAVAVPGTLWRIDPM